MSALDTQVGGNHYKDMKIQPIEYCHANKLGACETLAIRYISRWRNKAGIQDLRKAIHCLELLIELETKGEDKGEDKVAGKVDDFTVVYNPPALPPRAAQEREALLAALNTEKALTTQLRKDRDRLMESIEKNAGALRVGGHDET